jgi:CRP-like cAMP-binding protein/uncharacterized protein (DUF2225 family)
MSRLTELTYSVKKACPLCRRGFDHQKLLSKKFGPKAWDLTLKNIYDSSLLEFPDPLVYSFVTCPECLYAAYESDFEEPKIGEKKALDEARAGSLTVLKSLGVSRGDFEGLRDLKSGLATYYLGELWYDVRTQLSTRQFRAGLTLYRRAWLLDPAFRSGVISSEHRDRDRVYALGLAESSYEQSFLTESLPDSLYCGPDYAVNFGQHAFPFIIAICNYLLGKEPSLGAAERMTRLAKAQKFLGIAMSEVARKGMAELRNKVFDLKPLLVAEVGRATEPERPFPAAGRRVLAGAAPDRSPGAKGGDGGAVRAAEDGASARASAGAKAPASRAEDRSVRDEPTMEVVDWGLHFEALFERYGARYAEGDVIFLEGDEGNDVCFILEGKVYVQKACSAGTHAETRLLAVLGRGSFFGEMALLDSSPRFATVVAAEPTRVVRVSRENFEAIVRSYPAIALKIMEALVRRQRTYDAFVRSHILPLVVSGAKSAAPSTKPTLGLGDTLMVELQGLLHESREAYE